MTVKTPWPVTGMRWTVLILASWNILRLCATLATWPTVAEFAPRPGPVYIALTASFWTLTCLAVGRAIRRRNVHAQGYYAIIVLGYIAWWWADRLFLFSLPRTNGVFAAVVSVIFILDTIGTFFNRNITTYFTQRESHDQQPTNQPTA